MDKERIDTIVHNLGKVRRSIEDLAREAGRDPASIKLVAVSKNFPLEDLEAALRTGQRFFGENRVQELLAKLVEAEDRELECDWHMIGRLQTNKVKYLLGKVALIHSVDRIRLMNTIQRLAAQKSLVQDILLQVNVSGEESKGGFEVGEMRGVMEALKGYPNIRCLGLMTMAPFSEDPEEARPHFARLRRLREQLVHEFSLPHFQELSMGMTHDYGQAIQEGATILRIGSAIFGPRLA